MPDFYQINSDNTKESKKGFRFLFPYFSPYKRLVLQLVAGLIVGSLLQLAFPFLTQAIIDIGVNYSNFNFIFLILTAQLMLYLSQLSVEVIRGWLLLHISSRVNIRLVSSFLLKLMRLPIGFFDSKSIGDLLQRIQDHSRIQVFISNTSLNTLFSLFNVIVFGIVLLYYSPLILGIFVIGAILYVLWTILFLKRRAEIDYRYFDQAAGNQSSIIQLINGMQEIKLNGSEKRRRWEWEAIQIRLFKISIKGLSLSQTQTVGANFINEIKNILITFVAASMVIQGKMTLGMMLAVQYIIGQLNVPIGNLITFIQLGQDAKLSLERLSEIHEKIDDEAINPESQREIPTIKDIIIKDMSYRYGASSSPYVLTGISCCIPHGRVTAIVGESGSGKTTLIKLLLRFYEPTNGSINIGSTNLNNISPGIWRANCASVMQEGFIFSDSISRNISESDINGVIDKHKLAKSVETANIKDFIESLPNGYNTKIGASGSNISGGQKQRILIARAVYKDPLFVFLDEATSSLDANNEKVIIDNLNLFFKGKTVVIVAHRLSTVINADNIIVLEKGKIAEEGTHNQLIKKKSIYYSLIKNQLELGQ